MLHPSLMPAYNHAGLRVGIVRVVRHAHLRNVEAIHTVAASLNLPRAFTGHSDSQTKSKVPNRLPPDEDL